MRSMFSIILTFDEEYGGFVADVPQLPGCMSQGKTRDKAMKNIAEAIDLYIEILPESEKSKREHT
jgi:predicted RNase H-like HicB family nuclease